MASKSTVSKESLVNFPAKAPIRCKSTAPNENMLQDKPTLIFTHGSGGDLSGAAVANFALGFANVSPILCFQGNVNLASRIKMFKTVCKNQRFAKVLGGRSMGARAAVMATTEDTAHLVLVSYPLHTAKDSRDRALLDLPSNVKVIFISGDRDVMCELGRLEEVRKKMRCKTWMVIVKGADHGMNLKPKRENGSTSAGIATGKVVARWLGGFEEDTKEATLSWQVEGGQVQWCGWEIGIESKRNTGLGQPGFEVQIPLTGTPIEDDKKADDNKNQVESTKMSKNRRKRSERSVSERSVKKVKH